MKFKHLGIALLALPLAFGCNQNDSEKKDAKNTTAVDSIKQCYTAVFGGDTATMDLNLADSTKVTGNLLIKYAEKPKNDGILRGEFKGDTLFVNYTFKIGENPNEFSNPLALLKTDSALVMGVGVIETTLGRSYFVKDKPINFARGKFSFVPNDCK